MFILLQYILNFFYEITFLATIYVLVYLTIFLLISLFSSTIALSIVFFILILAPGYDPVSSFLIVNISLFFCINLIILSRIFLKCCLGLRLSLEFRFQNLVNDLENKNIIYVNNLHFYIYFYTTKYNIIRLIINCGYLSFKYFFKTLCSNFLFFKLSFSKPKIFKKLVYPKISPKSITPKNRPYTYVNPFFHIVLRLHFFRVTLNLLRLIRLISLAQFITIEAKKKLSNFLSKLTNLFFFIIKFLYFILHLTCLLLVRKGRLNYLLFKKVFKSNRVFILQFFLRLVFYFYNFILLSYLLHLYLLFYFYYSVIYALKNNFFHSYVTNFLFPLNYYLISLLN